MLTEHKNRLFNLIQDARMSSSYFELLEQQDNISIIKLVNSPILFMLTQSQGYFDEFWFNYTLYEPNFPMKFSPEEAQSTTAYSSINGSIINEFKYWLNAVVKRQIYQLEMPDLWSQIRFYSPYIDSSFSEEDFQHFSDNQKETIKVSIVEFKRLVVESFNPTREQFEFINARLEYLSGAVDKLNRFDWKGLAVSIITSIAINLTVDVEGGKLLFKLFQQAFDSVVQLLLNS
jgi:hypothetical protein